MVCQVLAYGQSEYVRQFGINVNPELHSLKARVLDVPTLQYGASSKQRTIVCDILSNIPIFGSQCNSDHAMVHGTCTYNSQDP